MTLSPVDSSKGVGFWKRGYSTINITHLM